MLMNVSAALSAYTHTRACRRQRTVTGVSLCPPLCLRHNLLFTAVCAMLSAMKAFRYSTASTPTARFLWGVFEIHTQVPKIVWPSSQALL